MYDIIGDVHGHASLLKKMLLEMGYVKTNGSYKHPSRKAIFTGDFIDRGPEIRKTIRIIRSMVEDGNAFAILGNHEINAIIYYLKDKQGKQWVKKPGKYYIALQKTIHEFFPYPEELKDTLDWMRTLPLFLDLRQLRIVHACWQEDAINIAQTMQEQGKIKKKIFRGIHKKPDSAITKAVWLLTKGIFLEMPSDLKIKNNKGISPRKFRVKWWEKPEGKTFEQLSFESKFTLPGYIIPPKILPRTYPYPQDAPPVFFGHYCHDKGSVIIKDNVCCVDSCVVCTGELTAYRWDGEKKLRPENVFRVK